MWILWDTWLVESVSSTDERLQAHLYVDESPRCFDVGTGLDDWARKDLLDRRWIFNSSSIPRQSSSLSPSKRLFRKRYSNRCWDSTLRTAEMGCWSHWPVSGL